MAPANQSAHDDQALSFTLPAGTFRDADTGNVQSYSAALAMGAALPDWLSPNAGTGVVGNATSKTPGHADVCTLSVRVADTDQTAGREP